MSKNASRSIEQQVSDFDRESIAILGGCLGITFNKDVVERAISAQKQGSTKCKREALRRNQLF